MKTISVGDRGPAVIEIRSMLQRLRLLPTGDAAISERDPAARVYDTSCALAIRQFQQERGLIADGKVDDDTYYELAGAGFTLGDRPLACTTARMLRGDDVRQLQQQLSELGFHQGNIDGTFGAHTAASVRAFQEDYGLRSDGICGASTVRALGNLLPKVTGGSPSLLRSRAYRRSTGTRLAGRHIYLDAIADDADGFTWNIAERVRDHLERLGARATLLSAREAVEMRARHANSSDAELYLSLRVATYSSPQAEGVAAFYFGSYTQGSSVGREFAGLAHREIVARSSFVDLGVHPRVREILRLTRMPAVQLELGHATSPSDTARMSDDATRAAIAEGVVAAIQRFYLMSADEQPTGTWHIPAVN